MTDDQTQRSVSSLISVFLTDKIHESKKEVIVISIRVISDISVLDASLCVVVPAL